MLGSRFPSKSAERVNSIRHATSNLTRTRSINSTLNKASWSNWNLIMFWGRGKGGIVKIVTSMKSKLGNNINCTTINTHGFKLQNNWTKQQVQEEGVRKPMAKVAFQVIAWSGWGTCYTKDAEGYLTTSGVIYKSENTLDTKLIDIIAEFRQNSCRVKRYECVCDNLPSNYPINITYSLLI